MPHKNAVHQLGEYGEKAGELAHMTNRLWSIGMSEADYGSVVRRYKAYVEQHKLRPTIEELCADRYAYNREIGALSLLYLWRAWKLVIPFRDNEKVRYERSCRAYAKSLSWTISLLRELMRDRRSGPAEIAIIATEDMEYASEETRDYMRWGLNHACESRFNEVRLEAVRHLAQLYPMDDEARHIVDVFGMQRLVEATRDNYEKVRDWGCFELWLNVSTLNRRVEAALVERFQAEDPASDAYMEAVTGLARLGHKQGVLEVIGMHLGTDDFGSGWVDAAVQSHDPKLLDLLIAARDRIRIIDPNRRILEDLDEAVVEWELPEKKPGDPAVWELVEELEPMVHKAKEAHETFRKAWSAHFPTMGRLYKDTAEYRRNRKAFFRLNKQLDQRLARVMNELKVSDAKNIGFALAYLAVNGRYFRSGYQREELCQVLKRVPLSDASKEVLWYVWRNNSSFDGRVRRKFSQLLNTFETDQ